MISAHRAMLVRGGRCLRWTDKTSFILFEEHRSAHTGSSILQALPEYIVQFLWANGLTQIAVHSGGQALLAVTFHRMGGQCNHQDALSGLHLSLTNRRGGFQSVHFRHLHVHQDQVERLFLEDC